MGAVYRATNPALGRDVALKVLPPELAADPARIERFQREARALASLNRMAAPRSSMRRRSASPAPRSIAIPTGWSITGLTA